MLTLNTYILLFVFTGRRSSESSSNNGQLDTSNCELHHNGTNGHGSRSPAPRRESKTPTPTPFSNISNIFSRKTSESLGLSQNGSRKSSLEKSDLGRKPSNELSSLELAGKTKKICCHNFPKFVEEKNLRVKAKCIYRR